MGLAYVPAVSSLIKWFPDRKGLASALAIMGCVGIAWRGKGIGFFLSSCVYGGVGVLCICR